MAAGKPIIGAISGDTKTIVEEANCGYVSSEQDVEQLAQNICEFSMLSIEEQKELGKQARSYYEKHFSKEQFMTQLEKYLREEFSS